MPNTPKKPATTKVNNMQVLNAVRPMMSEDYRNHIGVVNDMEGAKAVGDFVCSTASRVNSFAETMLNLIVEQRVKAMTFHNDLNVFHKGELRTGETMQAIYVDLMKAHTYNPATAEQKMLQREKPDIHANYFSLNIRNFYKTTIEDETWARAFLSEYGLSDAVDAVVLAMATSEDVDEWELAKYAIDLNIIRGNLKSIQVPTMSDENTKAIIKKMKYVGLDMRFPKTKYNIDGVTTVTPYEDQYLILNGQFDTDRLVDVMATSYHMDKTEFLGHVIVIDSFGSLDVDRITACLGDGTDYVPITSEQLSALDNIPGVLIDKDWLWLITKPTSVDVFRNPEGQYTNYWRHVQKGLNISSFANAAVFVPGKPVVNTVTVSPSVVTAKKGQTVQFSAVVKTEFFADQKVNWSSSDEGVTIDKHGLAYITPEAGSSVTVTATSVFDDSKTGEATLTIED